MKIKDVLEEVRAEIKADRIKEAKEILKERLLELDAAKKVLADMEDQLNELMEKEIDNLDLE